MKKIISISTAAIVAATLTSCDMLKEVPLRDVEKPVKINQEENIKQDTNTPSDILNSQPVKTEIDPRMKSFEEKQAKM
jgi:hypothetical protein